MLDMSEEERRDFMALANERFVFSSQCHAFSHYQANHYLSFSTISESSAEKAFLTYFSFLLYTNVGSISCLVKCKRDCSKREQSVV